MTRYPRSGRAHKWTVAELKAIAQAWNGDSPRDGDGLVGVVRCTSEGSVAVHFRYAFKRSGKKAWHYCGTWPTTSLESIRCARNQARDGLKRGLDPNAKREADRIEERARVKAAIAAEAERRTEDAPVSRMYAAWLVDGVLRKDGNAEIRRSFEKDVLPAIGSKAIRSVSEHDIRSLLRAMVGRGVNRMAVNLHCDLRQMFAWAEKRQPWRRLLQEGNPAELVEIDKVVSPGYDLSNVRTRVLDANEIRELRDIFAATRRAYEEARDKRTAPRPLQAESQAALWICLSTACRIGELLMSEWRHVNLDAATWFIPKENVKGSRGKKQDQLVSLSPFALSQFRTLHALTGLTRWCFPGQGGTQHVDVKSISKQVGDRQHQFKDRKDLRNRRNDNSLVLSKGANGEWTPHDLRRSAATMMQALGVTPEVIDRCQNHVLAGSRVRRHYLTHEYASEKREAWSKLGLAIESLLAEPDGHRDADKCSPTRAIPRATHIPHRSPGRSAMSRRPRAALPV